MRIGILTQPLENNYGGLLQNYALQTVLTKLGHDTYTINLTGKKDKTPFIKMASIVKRTILRILGNDVVIRAWPTKKESEMIDKNTQQFVKKNIKTTNLISRKVSRELLEEYAFDAYVVGSDQVWRPKYSPQLSTFFLDFLEDNSSVVKIAYAASFGVSDWEFTNTQTKKFGRLLRLFDAVSVREDSAVDLCKRYFEMETHHTLDPSMLLDQYIYASLAEKGSVPKSSGNLFTYILDKSTEKDGIINSIAKKFHLTSFSIMPQKSFRESGRKCLQECIFLPIEEWIRGFMDAQFVITDSFHGTVFSIIFNKPFISITNEGRGLTRFTSLLKLLQLEDRLVFSTENFNPEKLEEIDWEKTNRILEQEKEKSLQFLKKNLN